MQLTSRDLYRLRRARMLAQRAALRAQFAQQQLQELTLDLERRYGLLTKDAVMDVQTGVITVNPTATNSSRAGIPADLGAGEEESRGPADHADQGPP